MSEQLELSGSKERVAYDMATAIYKAEFSGSKKLTTDEFRKYFLTLYRQCHKATHNSGLETVLRED